MNVVGRFAYEFYFQETVLFWEDSGLSLSEI
jgi:hypothetical protein